MSKIIRQLHPEIIRKTAKRCRNREIVIPTFKQLRDPTHVPMSVRTRLAGVGMSELNPINLFRITWKNDVQTGLYGGVNYVEIPPAITGVKARVIGLVGSYFPTGAHKVGAAFGCLVPRLVSGEFDPEVAQGRLALDRQLLPRRRLRLRAARLHGHRDPARGDVPRALRLAQSNRRHDHRHARLRVERQGDLRQVLGAQARPGQHDLQPVRGVREPHLPLQRHRPGGRGGVLRAATTASCGPPPSSRRPAPRAPSPPATS